ncbi:MAG TPA: hypothetical protein PKK56_02525 [archaeon]|nr:hypothetical protein [archaeon]
MKTLKDIKHINEVIINFTTTTGYNKYQLLVEEDVELEKADIFKIFENNLTLQLDNGFSNEEIYFNTGMYIPSSEELEELEKLEEFFHIDKGYIINGLLLTIGR